MFSIMQMLYKELKWKILINMILKKIMPVATHRLGINSFLLKKKLTQLFLHLFFVLNIQKQHTESIIYMLSFRMWKNGAYFQ
jgi:hypothetical protein